MPRLAREVINEPQPGTDYALTEVVRCKTRREIGVAKSRSTCTDRYLDRTLALASTARLLILYGKHSVEVFNTRYELGILPDSRYAFANVAGQMRHIVWLDPPPALERSG